MNVIKLRNNNLRLLDVLNRDIQTGHPNGSVNKNLLPDRDLNFYKKEIFILTVLVYCLDYMVWKDLGVVEFCLKFNISCTNMILRLNSLGIEFDSYELRILKNNNIIH